MTHEEIIAAVEAEARDRFGPRVERFSHSFAQRKQFTVDVLAEDLGHPNRQALPKSIARLSDAVGAMPLEGYRVLIIRDPATDDEHVRIDVMTLPLASPPEPMHLT